MNSDAQVSWVSSQETGPPSGEVGRESYLKPVLPLGPERGRKGRGGGILRCESGRGAGLAAQEKPRGKNAGILPPGAGWTPVRFAAGEWGV